MKQLLIICSLALAGCTTQLGQFSVYCPGPRKVDLTDGSYMVDKTQKVQGSDEANIYLVIPSNAPTYDQTVKNAMKQRKGCVGLADVTLTRKSFWLLFGYCDFYAEGYPIVKKGAKK